MQFTVDDLVYLIPGIICVATYCFLIPGMKRPALEKLVLAGFIISFFEFLVFSSGTADSIGLFKTYFTSSGNKTVLLTLYNLFVFFILPVIFAVIAVLLTRWRAFRRWFHLSHPIPTAWDYKFASIKDARYIILTLNTGEIIYGLFDADSFASSDAGERDIYLSRTYTQDWEPTGTNDGLWVKHADIKYIEFIYTEKEG